jgi:hypothetical protein
MQDKRGIFTLSLFFPLLPLGLLLEASAQPLLMMSRLLAFVLDMFVTFPLG